MAGQTANSYKGVVGVGSIPFDEIFKWGLQEDVRRMIIGELADPESMLTFINALQTGQSGALATLHAQSVADTVTRVAQLLSSYYDRSVAWEYLGQNLRFIVHCQVVRSSTQERRFVTGLHNSYRQFKHS
ncbi:type II/IV secretion system protein [Ferrimicrobium acidiphilum DSM 19497]|jgi:Flp pilus assembly CpaF family ATPase|uniref:Type II/IV secretion system protein n=1 Tax=Ferrimicrobium acidiphilum DSM 19497 TaxID=1121877 RepID=A0A0D8FR64_9ACTN|nr:type II/IV secretion system protein [Ferrimicrobium acidiphilum DSM 19497]